MKPRLLPIILIAVCILGAASNRQKPTVRKDFNNTSTQVIPGQISVKFKKGTAAFPSPGGPVAFGVQSLDEKAERFEIKHLDKRFRHRPIPEGSGLPDLSRIYRITFPEKYSPQEVARAFSLDPNVEYATPDFVREYDAVPNDPMYDLQWQLPNIMAESAWDVHKGQAGEEPVVVAIIDCGVDWRHPDLRQNTWQNLGEDADGDGHTIEYVNGYWNLDPGDDNDVDDDWNGYADDMIGWDFYAYDLTGNGSDPNPINVSRAHGTHVAGIAAAKTDNGAGVASISWNVKFLATQTDYGAVGLYYGSDGILYAAEQGADVINCSWGGDDYNPVEADVIAYALGLGSIIICSAGNNNYNEIRFPAAYPGVFSTVALNSSDRKATYSSFGINADISAPGGDWDAGVYSTVPGAAYEGPDWFGTSMAAPLASGLAALIKSYHPYWTRQQVLYQLMGSCDNIDSLNPGYENCLGAGRINACRALTDTNVTVPDYLKIDLHAFEAIDQDGDGVLAAGDTVTLNLTLWNRAAFAAGDNAEITLQTSDPDITFISPVNTSCNIPADTLFFLDDLFRFRLSASCPPHWAEFLVTVEAEKPVIFGDSITFQVLVAPDGIFVFDYEKGRYDYSGDYIRMFLENIDQTVLYSNVYPNSFEGFDAVFLSLGNLGPNNDKTTIINYDQSMTLCDYLQQGGTMYLELGGFFIGGEYLGYPNAALMRDLFGVNTFELQMGANVIDTLSGVEGTPYEGIQFTKSTQRYNQYIDVLTAVPTAYCTFYENDYGNVGINNDGLLNQKTSYFGYALAELEDVDAQSSRYNILLQTMKFFGYEPGPAYVIANFTSDIRGGAEGDTIHFRDISLTAEGNPVNSWQWDFQNDGTIDSYEQNPDFTYSDGGLYDVRLIVSNGVINDTIVYPGYIRINSGVFVYEGVPGANDYSGEFIRDFLIDNDYDVTYMTGDMPVTFSGYDAIFLSFGNFGGLHFTPFDDTFAEKVLEYLQQGGKVYLEGGDAFGFDQSGNTGLFEAFGLADADDGPTSNYIDLLAGQDGSIMEGLVFTGSSQAAPAYIDIYTTGSGTAAFDESDYGVVGVQNETETRTGTARTFCFSYAVSGLDQDEAPNTREEVMWRILDYFGLITDIDDKEYPSYNSFDPEIFPNPTTGRITISFNNPGDDNEANIQIYNLEGRLVADNAFPINSRSRNQVSLELSGLEPGTYLLRLTACPEDPAAAGDEGSSVVRKIVKL